MLCAFSLLTPTAQPQIRGSGLKRYCVAPYASRLTETPCIALRSNTPCKLGVSHHRQHRQCSTAAAQSRSGSSNNSSSSHDAGQIQAVPLPAAAAAAAPAPASHYDEDADYADLAADDNIILLGSADEDDDGISKDGCYDPVDNINICNVTSWAAAAASSDASPAPFVPNAMIETNSNQSAYEDPCYDPINNINVCDLASRAAAASKQNSQTTPTAADVLAAFSSSDDDDESCYDPVLDINMCSTASQAASAAASAQPGHVISNAMTEEDFRAAMAAARRQVLASSGGGSSSSSEEDDGWWTHEEDDVDDGLKQGGGEDFWSTDKERVYLVGVSYKQQYQQQQQQQQQRQLFGSSSSRGGLGMPASSYSPWATDADSSSSSSGRSQRAATYNVHESIQELGRLAETAGLKVVGSTYQALEAPNNATYIGSGKVAEVARAVQALKVDTVIFDDELSPGQLRNLEKAFSGGKDGTQVAVADRTALILDIFNQRARTKEGKLQVELAQVEYQLPRLTRMWSHLDRVSGGGQVKGTGEKQIEIDKRLLRDRAAALRKELQAVRTHRAAHRSRRQDAPIPVVALVGYTNAGKSTLLNTLTDAGVLAEDKLFATLDPTTRKVRLPGGNLEVLFSDTVGFIQKLPTQLVAAFRATLEEIAAAAVVLHVLDVSADNAPAQCAAVLQVLEELGVQELPLVTAWNKLDASTDPAAVHALAASRPDTVAISGATGEGLDQLMTAIAAKLAESMVDMEVLLPYCAGALIDEVHKMGKILETNYTENGTHIVARVPRCLIGKLEQYSCNADSTIDDMDNGQLELTFSNDIYTDFDVDNASLEGINLDGQGGQPWDVDGSTSGSSTTAAVGSSDDTYQPHSVGSRAGKRAEKQRKQQQQSSLAQHQLPPDWLELVGGTAGNSHSSTVAGML